MFEVEEHQSHGGSLRVFAQRIDTGMRARKSGVDAQFQSKAEKVKFDFLEFLLEAKRQEYPLAGHGAAAKGIR